MYVIHAECVKPYPRINGLITFEHVAAVLPLLAAKQRMTNANDWMSTDALVACPDPNCKSMMKIIRTGIRSFRHSETTIVGLEGNT